MSTFQDFLNTVNGLASGSIITITKDWCTNHGLTVTANMMKGWGIQFSKVYASNNCDRYTVSPTQGTAKDKSITNLRHYIKK